MISSSSGLTGGFSVRIENQGIPREKGIGGSAALCSSIAASILGCKYSCETISEEVLFRNFGRLVLFLKQNDIRLVLKV